MSTKKISVLVSDRLAAIAYGKGKGIPKATLLRYETGKADEEPLIQGFAAYREVLTKDHEKEVAGLRQKLTDSNYLAEDLQKEVDRLKGEVDKIKDASIASSDNETIIKDLNVSLSSVAAKVTELTTSNDTKDATISDLKNKLRRIRTIAAAFWFGRGQELVDIIDDKA